MPPPRHRSPAASHCPRPPASRSSVRDGRSRSGHGGLEERWERRQWASVVPDQDALDGERATDEDEVMMGRAGPLCGLHLEAPGARARPPPAPLQALQATASLSASSTPR
jgi:hypothetical protein